MSNKRDILREGDRIKVIDPRIVIRVGYPKCHADFIEEVTVKHKTAVEALFKTKRMRKRAYSNLAYEALGAASFGGLQRSVHLCNKPEILGFEATVRSAHTVVTGKYYPPCSSRSYEGEYDYEPGGLSNCVYVRLVSIWYQWENIEIPATHCERIRE